MGAVVSLLSIGNFFVCTETLKFAFLVVCVTVLIKPEVITEEWKH